MRKNSHVVATMALFSVAALCMQNIQAQTVAPSPLGFEVASIKLSNSVDAVGINTPPGRFRAVGVTLPLLIRYAYGVTPAQIVGIPQWGTTDHYDIDATTGSAAVPLSD